ncbi:DUF6774 domain-containing protein [Anaerocolumna sp. AGMB13020]|jgi:hypothetical protein|uniref:DUF6774 domain-containing protein n=1 Tax=Anaerocolumna sp. AGMB13020 TaxID=3081750 RepID=UPI002953B4C5|nr:DUF6774 domain-containing protein [Anaerocolumna sp. AGMB13020]WOO39215.1 DUF6774 domain-containing protein [Anaerocolumna sp. AGMB13020]
MCPEELAAFAASLAIAISKDKTTDELDLIAVLLSQVSSTLATISIQKSNLEPDSSDNESSAVVAGQQNNPIR